ncbi:HNH endonuclease [Paenibacillus apiarius]|nr:HNH endonuclease signature motif containing protein [Paenibacillus apiarius]MCY9681829.1 HNH endonuclease [Paenibacillus apiarius]
MTMRKMKWLLSLLLVFTLSIGLLSQFVVAQSQDQNHVASYSSYAQVVKDKSVNPNEIKEVSYILYYDNKSGKSWTEQITPQQRDRFLTNPNQSLSTGVSGVLYTVLLQPIEGNYELEVRARINGFIGDKPHRIDFKLEIAKSVTRAGTAYGKGSLTKSLTGILGVQVGKEATHTFKINETGYWTGIITATAKNMLGNVLGSDVAYTRQILTNKRADVYPFYVDPVSGIVMKEPDRTDWAKTSSTPWTTGDRGEYIKKYSELYPRNGKNWPEYDIHHIRPRERGGTNAFDNLIPLLRTFHNGTVTPWWSGY